MNTIFFFFLVFPSPIKNLVPLASPRMMDSDGWMRDGEDKKEKREKGAHFLFLHPPSSLPFRECYKSSNVYTHRHATTQHEFFHDPYYVRITSDWLAIVF